MTLPDGAEVRTSPVHIQQMWSRVEYHGPGGRQGTFFACELFIEVAIKTVATALYAGLSNGNPDAASEIRQKLAVNASLGAWANASRQIVADYWRDLPGGFQGLIQWLNSKSPSESKKAAADHVERLYLAANIDREGGGRTWTTILSSLATLRNKTRGHGAPTDDFMIQSDDTYFALSLLILQKCPAFYYQWAYFDEFGAVDLNGPTPRRSARLGTSPQFGVFVRPDDKDAWLRCNDLLFAGSPTCTTFYLLNGRCSNNNKADYLDYFANRQSCEERSWISSEEQGAELSAPVPASSLRVTGAASTVGGLPAVPTRTVGRAADIEKISKALTRADIRLVTLIGPGGIGKTRLAQEVALQCAQSMATRPVFVSAEDQTSISGLLDTIYEAIAGAKTPNSTVGLIVETLGSEPTLLVLDNFEQLPRAANTVLGDILTHSPTTKILVTSQRPTYSPFEQQWPISELALPPEDAKNLHPEEAQTYSAIDMFVSMASRVKPDFNLTVGLVDDVIALCRSVSGVPLGIEIAAGLTKRHTIRELRHDPSRLATRHHERATTARHRSLESSVAWGYDFLSDPARKLILGLGFCYGMFTRDMAVGIATQTGLGALEAEDAFDELIEASFIQSTPYAGYRMLRFVAQFALERAGQGTSEARSALIRHMVGELRSPKASDRAWLESQTWPIVWALDSASRFPTDQVSWDLCLMAARIWDSVEGDREAPEPWVYIAITSSSLIDARLPDVLAGKLPGAQELLDAAIRGYWEDPDLRAGSYLQALMLLQLQEGHFQVATTTAARIQDYISENIQDPTNAEGDEMDESELAQFWIDQFRGATPDVSRALNLTPGMTSFVIEHNVLYGNYALFSVASTLLKENRPEDALKVIDRAWSLGEGDQRVRGRLQKLRGDVLTSQGALKGAFREYRNALETLQEHGAHTLVVFFAFAPGDLRGLYHRLLAEGLEEERQIWSGTVWPALLLDLYGPMIAEINMLQGALDFVRTEMEETKAIPPPAINAGLVELDSRLGALPHPPVPEEALEFGRRQPFFSLYALLPLTERVPPAPPRNRFSSTSGAPRI